MNVINITHSVSGEKHIYKASVPLGEHKIQVRVFSQKEAADPLALREMMANKFKTEAEWIEKVKRQCPNLTLANLDFLEDGTLLNEVV